MTTLRNLDSDTLTQKKIQVNHVWEVILLFRCTSGGSPGGYTQAEKSKENSYLVYTPTEISLYPLWIKNQYQCFARRFYKHLQGKWMPLTGLMLATAHAQPDYFRFLENTPRCGRTSQLATVTHYVHQRPVSDEHQSMQVDINYFLLCHAFECVRL